MTDRRWLTAIADLPGRERLRSASSFRYEIPQLKLKFGERGFSYAGPKAWNSLPSIWELPFLWQALSTAPVPFSTTDSSQMFSRIRRIMSSSAELCDVSLHLLSSTGIFYQAPVDFCARRCQISHTALLIYQPPSFIERLACFIKMRTLYANCAGKRGSTHSQSQRGSRSSSQFTGSPFRSSQITHHRLSKLCPNS